MTLYSTFAFNFAMVKKYIIILAGKLKLGKKEKRLREIFQIVLIGPQLMKAKECIWGFDSKAVVHTSTLSFKAIQASEQCWIKQLLELTPSLQ